MGYFTAIGGGIRSSQNQIAVTIAAYSFVAPAKLNLFLHITGRRKDGYHSIQTLLHLLDWGDRVRLETSKQAKDEILWQGPFAHQVPKRDNLVNQLLARLRAKRDIPSSLRLTINKEVPVAAGLGGASSLAASLLLALNRRWNLGMTQAQLMKEALSLGSDIPFFVLGETALASGRGEKLQPFACRCYYYLLACPRVECPTAALFGATQLNRSSPPLSFSRLSEDFWLQPQYQNVFLPLVLDSYPPVRALYDLMTETTAAKLGDRVLLSGSGGTLFVVYKERDQATRAYESLKDRMSPTQGDLRLARGIALSPVVEQFGIS